MSNLAAPDITGQKVLEFGGGGTVKGEFTAQPTDYSYLAQQRAMVQRVTDPVIIPQPYAQPADFTAQYPIPLSTLEIIAMCEEVSVWAMLREEPTALNGVTWRELNSLAFTSGSSAISFADGECPSEFTHDGTNTTVNHKNIGAKKTISERDLMHSMAVSAANWNGINALLGPVPASAGLPGGSDMATITRENAAGVKMKETLLATSLVTNGWDRLLVLGDVDNNSLEFDGITNLVTAAAGAHVNSSAPSGTFSAATFDRFLSEGCAKPTHVFGHPQAIQEMMSGYFQLGFAGSQTIFLGSGDRLTPGYNFASVVRTGIGDLTVVSDVNFPTSDLGGGTFFSTLYPLRVTHNGEPLVYKSTQIPLTVRDLVPGCTAMSFEVWAATALIIKHACAQARFSAVYTGNIVQSCTLIS